MSDTPAFRSNAVSIVHGSERESLLERLSRMSIDGSGSAELRGYLEADLDRFLYTLALLPENQSGRGLEVGANPYFMSILAREQRPGIQFDYINYFEGSPDIIRQVVRWPDPTGNSTEHLFQSWNVNLENGTLDAADGAYDFILFCEVLEHFTMDPLHCVLELNRLLSADGFLVLTTPNVARFENVGAILDGRNLYDPYSGYGPHGRHNREYTRHELHLLMGHAGFTCDLDFTSDVHGNIPSGVSATQIHQLLRQIQHREHDLGQYLFSRWRKSSEPARSALPEWLYRSYPAHRFQ